MFIPSVDDEQDVRRMSRTPSWPATILLTVHAGRVEDPSEDHPAVVDGTADQFVLQLAADAEVKPRRRQLHLDRPVRAHLRRRYFTLTTSITNHSVELPGMLSPLPSEP